MYYANEASDYDQIVLVRPCECTMLMKPLDYDTVGLLVQPCECTMLRPADTMLRVCATTM